MKHNYSTDETLSERDAAWFEELAGTLERGRAALMGLQHADGHWCAAVESGGHREAEFVLLLAFLGRSDDPRTRLAANHLLTHQRPDGTWGDDLSASVRAYVALKIAGHSADEEPLRRAAEAIRARGGAEAAELVTRVYLAALGQLPYSACPAVPVQAVLLPKRLGGLDAYPEWERATRVALGIIRAHEPVTRLPETAHVRELFVQPPVAQASRRAGLFRARAVRTAANWLRARAADTGPGSSFRALALNAIALRCSGTPADDAAASEVTAQLEALCATEGGTLRVRAFRAPVTGTALALVAATDTGTERGAAARNAAARWLLECDRRPAHPRDTDATALVLTALARGGHVLTAASSEAVYRALNGLLATQNRDGGWAAFDREVSGDPSCPATTARVLEAIGHFGFRLGQAPVDAAVRFILDRQAPDGYWQNRWGAGALQTTWHVLAGLHAVGSDVYALPARRAVRWLKEEQNADAGWGGSTPSETAWAVLALLAAGEGDSIEARAGAEFLLGTQRADGTWPEADFTGTGVEPGTQLRDELYPVCFPLIALGRYRSDGGKPVEPQKVFIRADAGHVSRAPKSYRHTLAEM